MSNKNEFPKLLFTVHEDVLYSATISLKEAERMDVVRYYGINSRTTHSVKDVTHFIKDNETHAIAVNFKREDNDLDYGLKLPPNLKDNSEELKSFIWSLMISKIGLLMMNKINPDKEYIIQK